MQAVFLALCGFAERDPEQDRWEDHYNQDSESFTAAIKRYWNNALDDIAINARCRPSRSRGVPAPRRGFGFAGDPWESAAPVKSMSSFGDEPPF